MIWPVLQRLLAEPGVSEIVELRSSVGFMALHGGSLEEETDVIAAEAAALAGAALYAVLPPPDLPGHSRVWAGWDGRGPVPPMAALIEALARWARSPRPSPSAG